MLINNAFKYFIASSHFILLKVRKKLSRGIDCKITTIICLKITLRSKIYQISIINIINKTQTITGCNTTLARLVRQG